MVTFTASPTIARFMQDNSSMRVLMGPVGCTPGSTEFLTPNGWVRIDQWTPEHTVGVWDPESNDVHFEAAEYVNLPMDEEFIRFKSNSLTMELSPEHTVAYYDTKKHLRTTTAAAIADRPSRRIIPTTFNVRHEGLPISDGVIRTRVRLAPYAVKKTSLDFIWKLNTRQLRIVLEEIDHWDGLYDHAEKRYYSTILAHAEAIQFAAHACGYRATIRTETYANALWKDHYIVAIRRPGSRKNTATIREHTTITSTPSTDGRKYCFTTSTGFWVARCEGSIFITGNSGKSVGCVFEVLHRASMQTPNHQGIRKTRCIVIRETVRQLVDTTIKTFLDWLPPETFGTYAVTSKTYYMKFGDIECEVMFRALDDARDVANLNSLEATFAWINECRDAHPNIVSALTKRVGRYPSVKDGGPTWSGVWGDTNPPVIGSWWYAMMEKLDPDNITKPKPNNWAVFKQPSGLSPEAENIQNLPKGYYNTDGLDEDFIRVYIKGEYGLSNAGRPVFKSFNTNFHCSDKPLAVNSFRSVVVGVDLGLTPAAVFGQVDAQGRVLILDELVVKDSGAKRFVEEHLRPKVFSRFPSNRIVLVVDPAGTQRAQTDEATVVSIFRKAGFYVIPAKTNLIIPRLEAVDEYLRRQIDGKAAFLIDPRCTHLRAALNGGYRFEKREQNKICKNEHSHIADALQYLMLHIHHNDGTMIQPRVIPIKTPSFAAFT